MDNERTADVLQVALASYDRKELRVQKNYLEEQNPVLACTCFLNGHKLLQELYRMPGQQWQRTEQQCQQLYHSWGIRIPDINCSYLTSAVGVVYGTSQKLAIRKEILQAVSEQYGVSVSAVDSGIRRMIDQLEAKPDEGWMQFKAESGFEAEKPTTGKLIYAIKRYLIQQKSRE